MECKAYWFLAAVLCLASAFPPKQNRPPYACQCLMDVKDRKDCGFPGITAEQCTKQGCCFDARVSDVPWCFKPSGERASLNYAKKMIEPQARIDCGYHGITRKRCKRIGCCFDRHALQCFHPPLNNVSQACTMDMSAREDCGFPGITAEDCQAKGCCFDSYVVSTRWCFHPLSKTGCIKHCGMAPKERVQCGNPGISTEECLGKGCCYEHYQYDTRVPWCFEPLAKQGNFSLPFLGCEVLFLIVNLTFQGLENTMEQKGIWLLSLIFIVGLSTLVEGAKPPPECRCHIDPKTRTNCGPPGITPQQCKDAGCCFSSEVAGVPWCFHPAPPKYKKVCPAEVKARRNCGYPGIPADICESRGCCFESNPPAVPWCFYHILVAEEC
ncbi:trefoil factor 1 [Hemicordylus capensis]|uniref:trefoil factor 1 n=1 Tax=Hemicordylus capensis TaxID=884348 RepID=UPI00230380E4|nr:trefoil factor 1 [Hemicordylus capensis]